MVEDVVKIKIILLQQKNNHHLRSQCQSPFGCSAITSNKLEKVSNCKEKQSKLNKYLCFTIYSHGNGGKLLLFHSNQESI
jgi:hypothetical protein